MHPIAVRLHDRSALFASNVICTTLPLDDCQLLDPRASFVLSRRKLGFMESGFNVSWINSVLFFALAENIKKLVSLDKSPSGVMYVALSQLHIFHH